MVFCVCVNVAVKIRVVVVVDGLKVPPMSIRGPRIGYGDKMTPHTILQWCSCGTSSVSSRERRRARWRLSLALVLNALYLIPYICPGP